LRGADHAFILSCIPDSTQPLDVKNLH
jgi:hypothetical protein